VNLGDALDDYAPFAAALAETGLVSDPWVDGAPRFGRQPLRLPATEHAALAAAAEAVGAVYHELCLLVRADPALLDGFFALTPVQRLLWEASAPLWHGIARADVFLIDGPGGPRPVVCELNCDTPSGQPEAVILGPLAGVPAERDPNAGLEARFARMLDAFGRTLRRPRPEAPLTVGIVYPTELTGDLALVRLYQSWCERRGHQVVLGSPFNLQGLADDGVALFGRPCDLVLRHYKTDWWGERLPIWDDEEPYPDPDPLTGPLVALLRAQLAGRCAVVNPFGAVVPQNKRAMAFMWEQRARFSAEAQATIAAHVPETVRLEAADRARLHAEQESWVVKSDYGCEGEEVVLGAAVSTEEWEATLAHALPHRFVAQRYFEARRDGDGQVVNHGIYLVGGRAAGLYARQSRGATHAGALSVPVEVVP
jgi:hypothetical protein